MRALLSVALYEPEDERTPQYAVVDAAVETAKFTDAARAGGLINAVLRRYLRERKTLDAEIARTRPRVMRRRWARGPTAGRLAGTLDALLAAGDSQAPMWLRSIPGMAPGRLPGNAAQGRDWRARRSAGTSGSGIGTPCDVHDLPGFAQGLCPSRIREPMRRIPLGLAAGQRVLDACAAPGGKTALIAEREPHLAHVDAVDIDPQRLTRVQENLQRGDLKAEPSTAMRRAGLRWDGIPFDRVLLDAPVRRSG